MNLERYTPLALRTALPTALAGDYLGPALIAEAHELTAASYSYDAKLVRDGTDKEPELAKAIVKELGDVAWPTAVILHLTGEAIGDLDDLEDARNIDHTHELDDPLAEIIRRAGRVAAYLEWSDAGNPAGHWFAHSEAWALWCVLEEHAETISDRDLAHALEENVRKLADRQARGVLAGSGDNR